MTRRSYEDAVKAYESAERSARSAAAYWDSVLQRLAIERAAAYVDEMSNSMKETHIQQLALNEHLIGQRVRIDYGRFLGHAGSVVEVVMHDGVVTKAKIEIEQPDDPEDGITWASVKEIHAIPNRAETTLDELSE